MAKSRIVFVLHAVIEVDNAVAREDYPDTKLAQAVHERADFMINDVIDLKTLSEISVEDSVGYSLRKI